jgi:hypothetical protein
MAISSKQVRRWRADPTSFITDVLCNPETGQPFELYPAEVEFTRRGFTLTADGKLPFPEMLFNAPKRAVKLALRRCSRSMLQQLSADASLKYIV